MDYYLIVYILFSIALIFSGVYFLIKVDKMVGALIYGMGSILVCVFYGLRWFNGNKLKTLGYNGSWPPHINMCPDYFTIFNSGGKSYCVDSVGFLGNKFNSSTQTINAVSVSLDSNGNPTGTATISQTSGAIPISGTNAINIKTKEGRKKACHICQQNEGLTWEGIYDGSQCVIQDRDDSGGNDTLKKCKNV